MEQGEKKNPNLHIHYQACFILDEGSQWPVLGHTAAGFPEEHPENPNIWDEQIQNFQGRDWKLGPFSQLALPRIILLIPHCENSLELGQRARSEA